MLKPYSAYKDAGVDSVGEIPAHWEMKRLWHLTPAARRIMYGIVLPGPSVQDGVPIIKGGDVSANRLRSDSLSRTTFEIESGYARSRLRGGDLVYAIRGSIGEVAVVPDELEGANLTQDAARIAYTNKTEGSWLLYALKSVAVFSQLEVGALGATIKGINIHDLKRAAIPVPPRIEQGAIGAFLDHETAKIDALVAKKERLIELLQEKCTSLITQAVTKGLDPKIAMKVSGVDWLEWIPAHWKPLKIKRLFREAKRQGFEDLTVLSVYREHGVIEKASRDDNFNRTPEDLSKYQLVQAGDLVINKMKAWQGSLGVSDYSGITSPDYIVYAPRHSQEGRFLHHLLRSKLLAQVYLTMSNGIRPSQWRLEPERFENLVVFLPPRSEQVSICDYIDSSMRRINDLIERVGSAMHRLNEFRIALISAAVTGKIDVRSA